MSDSYAWGVSHGSERHGRHHQILTRSAGGERLAERIRYDELLRFIEGVGKRVGFRLPGPEARQIFVGNSSDQQRPRATHVLADRLLQ